MSEAKIIEPVPDATSIGLFLTINTKWEIDADLSAHQNAGVDLSGLYVVRRNPQSEERRLVGQISSILGSTVHLAAACGTIAQASASTEVFCGGLQSKFLPDGSRRCWAGTMISLNLDDKEKEARFVNGPAINALLKQFHQFFQKDPNLQLTPDLWVTIGEQLVLENSTAYQTIHRAAPVQYYFNPARTKASQYPCAWASSVMNSFSKDTFPKLAVLNILVAFPDTAQGATERFLNFLRDGITLAGRSQYEGGLSKLYGLLNPTFTMCKIPLLQGSDPAKVYRQAIEEHLAGTTTAFDAAIVVLNDQHAVLPDTNSPYLTAKATLMLAGIPDAGDPSVQAQPSAV